MGAVQYALMRQIEEQKIANSQNSRVSPTVFRISAIEQRSKYSISYNPCLQMHFITSCESDQALNKLQLQNKGACS